jgi:integrase
MPRQSDIRLTKRVVEAAAPKDRDYFIWDKEVKGFGVRILPSGTKTYQVQYQMGGRLRRMSIGRHGTITAEIARAKAKEMLGDVCRGANPAQDLASYRRAPTVTEFADRFFEQHATERCKPSTQKEYRRCIDLFIMPAMGTAKLMDITRADVSELHHRLKDKPYQANRVLGVLSKMFNMAEVWGLRADGSNPCRHVAKYPERKRERYLSQIELRRLGEALNEAQRDGTETPFMIAAFRLLILTGCRLGEIQTLKWEYITPLGMELPDSKTGARRVPLPQAARDILAGLSHVEGNPYVIAGKLPGAFATDFQHPWRRIRSRAGLHDVRIHDLRHTYASNAVSSGMPIQMVGKLLGHPQLQTTMRYAHLADDAVRQAAEENAARLSALVNIGTQEKPTLRVVR